MLVVKGDLLGHLSNEAEKPRPHVIADKDPYQVVSVQLNTEFH